MKLSDLNEEIGMGDFALAAEVEKKKLQKKEKEDFNKTRGTKDSKDLQKKIRDKAKKDCDIEAKTSCDTKKEKCEADFDPKDMSCDIKKKKKGLLSRMLKK